MKLDAPARAKMPKSQFGSQSLPDNDEAEDVGKIDADDGKIKSRARVALAMMKAKGQS